MNRSDDDYLPEPEPSVLLELERGIEDAKSLPDRGAKRAQRGADLNGRLRAYRQTPEIRALRRRIFVELLDMDPGAAPEPEPTLTAGLPRDDPGRWVVMLFADGDPDGGIAGEVSRVYLAPDEAGATMIGPRLATLHGQDWLALPVSDVPAELTAQERLDEIRSALDTSVFAEDVVARIARTLGEPWPRSVSG